jgi:GTP cyclohydrolase IA
MDGILDPRRIAEAEAKNVAKRPSRKKAEAAVRTLLAFAGENPEREGLIETPDRVLRAYEELFAGYRADVKEILSKTFKDVGGYDDIVLVKNIPFFSHCEHHMVPFFGQAHIAYLPHGGVVGLSKLARLVDAFARRFQTQENLTQQIVDALNEHLDPRGTAVMLQAEHMCMTMRGVRAHGALTVTQRFTGVFAEDGPERRRFFEFVRSRDGG